MLVSARRTFVAIILQVKLGAASFSNLTAGIPKYSTTESTES